MSGSTPASCRSPHSAGRTRPGCEAADALRQEARVLDLIHQVNTRRRDAGLDITDRIFLTLPGADSDLLEHQDWIAAETLARSITVGDTLSLIKAT